MPKPGIKPWLCKTESAKSLKPYVNYSPLQRGEVSYPLEKVSCTKNLPLGEYTYIGLCNCNISCRVYIFVIFNTYQSLVDKNHEIIYSKVSSKSEEKRLEPEFIFLTIFEQIRLSSLDSPWARPWKFTYHYHLRWQFLSPIFGKVYIPPSKFCMIAILNE